MIMFNANISLAVSRSRVKSLLTIPLVFLSTGLECKAKGRHDICALHTPSAVNILKVHKWFPTVRIRYDLWTDNINSTMTGQVWTNSFRVPDRAHQFPSLTRLYRSAAQVIFVSRERRPKREANHSFPSGTDSMCNNESNCNSAPSYTFLVLCLHTRTSAVINIPSVNLLSTMRLYSKLETKAFSIKDKFTAKKSTASSVW